MTPLSDHLAMLERELRHVFSSRLRSLIAYGLSSDSTPGDGHAPHTGHGTGPRTTTMAIVESLGERDLTACAARVPSWHDAGLATPLLLTTAELEGSLDAFPLEFSAMIADHFVVSGPDPFDALSIDALDVRRACEVQARSHLLHLREGFLETRGNADALAVLIVRSAAPFAALLASIARLQGQGNPDHAAAGRHAERELKLPPGAATDVVALAHVTEIPAAEAQRILPSYLDAVERLVAYVDGWSA